MVSDSFALLLFIGLIFFWEAEQRPRWGLSPVEWGEIPCVRMYKCPFIRPSVRRPSVSPSSWLDLARWVRSLADWP